jgi:hypothetical protein
MWFSLNQIDEYHNSHDFSSDFELFGEKQINGAKIFELGQIMCV